MTKKLFTVCCKFLRSIKLEGNCVHTVDFASVELSSVTYLDLYLARKFKTQQSCNANKL